MGEGGGEREREGRYTSTLRTPRKCAQSIGPPIGGGGGGDDRKYHLARTHNEGR